MGARILALAACALPAAACGVQTIAVAGNVDGAPKADILFVIDDFSIPTSLQSNLLRNLPVLMTSLQTAPQGPDLHIAFVSPDMGAGNGSIPGCGATGGKNGVFQFKPRGVCQATLDPGATFISDDEARGVRNYTGQLDDAMRCIAPLGASGCSFQQPLAAATRALGADGSPAPPENAGFLRPDAFLFIMIVTDQDDCSAPPGSPLFDTAMNATIDSPLGLPRTFRCNEFGHLCDGARPPRLPPDGDASAVVTLDDCTSATSDGLLTPVAQAAAQIRALKQFPDDQIIVAAIAGPTRPYTIRWVRSARDGAPTPQIAASCTASDMSGAVPAIRLADWVHEFGDNGLLTSACDDSFAPDVARLAEQLNRAR